jgi:exonuclease III
VGVRQDAIQHGSQGAKPSDTKPIGTGLYGSGSESGFGMNNSNLSVLALNVRGIMSHGRSEQARLLMIKHKVSIAILSETETTHAYSATTHMEGFRALCPPTTVTGPPGKEVGVIMMVSADIASSSIQRPDINGSDTVQTVWTELTHLGLIIGGVYRRNRPSQPDLEKEEMAQLTNQILKAAQTGKAVLLLGDLNLDHSNPDHKKKNEANDLLCAIEAATMRHLPTGITWKSDGYHKVCNCVAQCDCPKRQRTATIDNVYLSNSESASAVVLEDALSDHFPIMVGLDINKKAKMTSKLKTIFRRDIARIVTSELEDALQEQNWSSLYKMSDPNEAVTLIVRNVEAALDKVAPLKPVTFRPDKPKLSLRQDTLDAMSLRDAARKSGNRSNFKALRNKVTRLVKRDKINSVLTRLKKNPGHKVPGKKRKPS